MLKHKNQLALFLIGFFLIAISPVEISAQPNQEKANKTKDVNYDKLARQATKDRKKIKAFDDGESKTFDKVERPTSAGDRTYNKLGFKASIEQYLAKKNLTSDDKLKIANAYRLVHDTENSETWYRQAINETEDPKDYLHYAQALQSNGKMGEAAQYYALFDEKNTEENSWNDLAKVFAASVAEEGQFRHTNTELRNEHNINTNKLEYSPAFYKDGIIYVSTKKPEKMKMGKDRWLDENFMSLYYAKNAGNELLDNSEEFSYNLTSKYHEGPVSFTNGYNKLFFTRNHFNGSRKNNSEGIMKLQIYSSEFNGNKWGKPKELNINTREFEEAHPTLTSDGNTMYFSSDRTGGFGGMDLYKTTFDGEDWTDPENLGPSINTAGNEVFPFIHKNNMLFYSSNGLVGMGGLDIFYASTNDEGKFSQATNIGTPFNSKKDDFGFIVNPKGDFGYLTSARRSGNGGDDIYSFPLPYLPTEQTLAEICVYDEETMMRIPGADVKVALFSSDKTLTSSCFGEGTTFDLQPTNNNGEYLMVLKSVESDGAAMDYVTDDNGYFQMTIDGKTNYRVEANVEGYDLTSDIITFTEFEESNGQLCIPVRKTPDCPDLRGTVWNEQTGQPLPGAQVTLINECTGEQTIFTSDESGNFMFPCLECGCNYYLKAEKGIFTQDITQFEVPAGECTKANSVHQDLHLRLELDESLIASNRPVAPKAGDVIVLENIFYDFDKYYIRSDAHEELNHVVGLLNKYPEMIIELGSHTDSRGSHQYNEVLSSNRAKSAVQYIVERGIDSRRIVAKGYGETTNRNHCKDGVKCSEELHQFNRRTEIKVLHFPNSEVEVKYNDNRPEYIDSAPKDVIGGLLRTNKTSPSYSQSILPTENRFVNAKPVRVSNHFSQSDDLHYVIVGSYSTVESAAKKLNKVRKLGFEGQIITTRDNQKHRISIGSFATEQAALSMKSSALDAGLKAFVASDGE